MASQLSTFKTASILLICVNVALSILAVNGMFEGKDLLPILIGVLSVVGSGIFLYIHRRDRSKVLWLVVLALSGVGLYFSHFEIFMGKRRSASIESSIQALQNNPAPPISYTYSMNFDESLDVKDLYKRNRYTIVNFWATWCAPCLKEMPILEDFYKENSTKGIGLIGFTDYSFADEDELSKIKDLIHDLKITYPVLVDNTKSVRTQYKADLLPATVLIDREGRVVDYQVGIDGAKKLMQYAIEN